MCTFLLIQFIFMQFLTKIIQYNNRLALPFGVGGPSKKSWICHCYCWFHHWPMMHILGLCIVNVHWCRNSNGFLIFGIRFFLFFGVFVIPCQWLPYGVCMLTILHWNGLEREIVLLRIVQKILKNNFKGLRIKSENTWKFAENPG